MANVCQRVLVLYGGRIVEQGAVDDVFSAPRHPYTRALLDAIPPLDDEAAGSQAARDRRLRARTGSVSARVSVSESLPARRCDLRGHAAARSGVACWHPLT